MEITQQIEWDMGHRITNHRSKCHNLHGHRYKLEICLQGELISETRASDEGMVMDFGDVKKIAMKYVHDQFDHGFMIWEKDLILFNFFKQNFHLKHVIVPFIPTAENISHHIFNVLDKHYIHKYKTNLQLSYVRLWETPNSTAICSRK